MTFQFLPPALLPFASERRFCIWFNVVLPGRDEPTKVPFGLHSSPAKSNDPSTWLTFAEAEQAWHEAAAAAGDVGRRPDRRGGMALFLGDGLAGLDMDTCIDGAGVAPWAQDVLSRLGSQGGVEISPSGTGIKAFLRFSGGDLPLLKTAFRLAPEQDGRNLWKKSDHVGGHPPGIELYLGRRFFAFTGDALQPGANGDLPVLDNMLAGALVTIATGLGGMTEDGNGAGGGERQRDASDPLPLGREEAGRKVVAARAVMPDLDAILNGDDGLVRARATDTSRSGIAFGLIGLLKRAGLTWRDCCEVLEGCACVEVSSWYAEKGRAHGGREVERKWRDAVAVNTPMPAIGPTSGARGSEKMTPFTSLTGGGTPPAGQGESDADDGEWLGLLQGDRAGYFGHVSNALVLMTHDPEMRGAFQHDEFRYHNQLVRPLPPGAGEAAKPGPYPRSWTEEDVTLAHAYLQRRWGFRFSRTATQESMSAVAMNSLRHPVREWLDSLKWDGTARIDNWMATAFGCVDDLYHRKVSSIFLIAAVRRIRKPGCKFDYIPILEENQGAGKSRAVEALFGREWYTDHMPADIASKDASAAMSGVWGIELAEIDVLIRAETETVKAFLTRSVDRYRPAYGRITLDFPRQCVMIGTTNKKDYLRDETGNRRMWPVQCTRADVDAILKWREQWWAEAVVREAQGEDIWLGVEAERMAAEHQAERMVSDVWEPHLDVWLEMQPDRVVTGGEALTMALNLPRDRMSRRDDMRVAVIFRKLGWESYVGRDLNNKIKRGWRRKGSEATWKSTVAVPSNVVPFVKPP